MDPWSCASQSAGPAPPGTSISVVGSEGAAGRNPAAPAGGPGSWPHPPGAWSTARWDCSPGPESAAYWDSGLGGEVSEDCKTSWGWSAGSDFTASWNVGLQDCSVPGEGHRALTTPSKSSQRSDRATLTRHPKTNHRGKRLRAAEEVKDKDEAWTPCGAGSGKLAAGVGSCTVKLKREGMRGHWWLSRDQEDKEVGPWVM